MRLGDLPVEHILWGIIFFAVLIWVGKKFGAIKGRDDY